MITQSMEDSHTCLGGKFRKKNKGIRAEFGWAVGFVLMSVLGLVVRPVAAQLPYAQPAEVGMRADRLQAIERLVHDGLSAKRMPGCVILIGRKGSIVYERAFGYRQLVPEKVPMTVDTVFDMASITKPVATATSVMVLFEQGRIRLRDGVSTYLPTFGEHGKQSITVHQLLTHQAGLIPDNSIQDYDGGQNVAFENIHRLKTHYEPGTKFVYSDVGFVVLGELIEKQGGLTVAEFAKRHIFEPLGMTETGYLPSGSLRARAAVTEQRDGAWIQGEVHDPRAYRMGGVAGHAGLFSTARDLAVYAQMMLNGGEYCGTRVLSRPTVDLMVAPNLIVEDAKTSIRGLGWDKQTGYSSNRGENFTSLAFGHGGFTGTVLWMDPGLDLFFIFLSNRVHPHGKGSVNHLAGRIATVAASAVDDKATASRRLRNTQTGVDVLVQDGFRLLADQRVGLITNHTGINRDGVSTAKLLQQSKVVDLRVLFSPEHGIAGKLDQSHIRDAVDGKTGMDVFSLYGRTRKPTSEQLADVDTLVFDIQDIGCRFYTYISTMGLAMQAAAEHGKRFVVLDRPNPINGIDVNGPMLDPGRESFVGFHELPIRHGMTIGELAKMFQAELDMDLQLEVVACENWKRPMYFDQTGLWWVSPSPNMRNLNQAMLYPGIGVWESTNLSVGRGTDTPFELIGAPWIKGIQLAARLNAASIPGVQFTPRRFVPESSKFAGENCEGVQISITDRTSMDPIRLGVEFATLLYGLHPLDWEIGDSYRLLNNQQTLDAIKVGASASQILQSMRPGLEAFRLRRANYLIYGHADNQHRRRHE